MTQELRLSLDEQTREEVSALLERPQNADCLLVLAHGAGAGMRHAFMEEVTTELSQRRIATLRYQFPYMEQGRRAPSPRATLLRTVRSAARRARELEPGLPLLVGGKSMGGRMSSLAASEQAIPGAAGLVFFGFPLHAAGKPGTARADHLQEVSVPMLFLQGTRDKLAELDLLRPICAALGPSAKLHIVEDGDHSFHVRKRSGRNDSQVMAEICDAVREFADERSD